MLEEALKEKGFQIYKNEGLGFLSYKQNVSKDGQKFVEIADFYLVAEKRNQAGIKEFFEQFENFCKENELHHIIWFVASQNQNKEFVLIQCLLLGFKVKETDKQGIILLKQV